MLAKRRRKDARRKASRPRCRRYAVPVPSAISVNIFRLRFTIDAQPRSKNGQPPHRTTGVASRARTSCGARPDTSSPQHHGQRKAEPESPRMPVFRVHFFQRRGGESRGLQRHSAFGQSPAPSGGPRDASGRCIPRHASFRLAPGWRYFSGSPSNFAPQPLEQK